MDPLQWMGAVRMRVQTAVKKTSGNQTIHRTFAFSTLNHCFRVKYESTVLLSIILLSPVKKLYHLNQGRKMHRPSSFYKWKQWKTNIWQNFDVRGQQGMGFSLKEALFLYFGQKQCFVSFKCWAFHFTKGDYLWITVLLSVVCLSFWRHPFTAEYPLVSKWYNVKFILICSDEETN